MSIGEDKSEEGEVSSSGTASAPSQPPRFNRVSHASSSSSRSAGTKEEDSSTGQAARRLPPRFSSSVPGTRSSVVEAVRAPSPSPLPLPCSRIRMNHHSHLPCLLLYGIRACGPGPDHVPARLRGPTPEPPPRVLRRSELLEPRKRRHGGQRRGRRANEPRRQPVHAEPAPPPLARGAGEGPRGCQHPGARHRLAHALLPACAHQVPG